jgi:hypothetical protein
MAKAAITTAMIWKLDHAPASIVRLMSVTPPVAAAERANSSPYEMFLLTQHGLGAAAKAFGRY